jgi:hypothetical protein
MSFWDVSDVVEWLRLQHVPNAGLLFSFRHGIDGETMDESVQLIVKDLQLPSVEEEELLVRNWRALSDSGLEPDVVFGYRTQNGGETVGICDHSNRNITSAFGAVPVQDNAPGAKRAVERTYTNAIDENNAADITSEQPHDCIQHRFRLSSNEQAGKAAVGDEDSIPDETPLMLTQPSVANTVDTDIQVVRAVQSVVSSPPMAPSDGAAPPASPPSGDKAPVSPAAAETHYQDALRKQAKLLRIQQERIHLQTMMIDRQREQLHSLELQQHQVMPLHYGRNEPQPQQAAGSAANTGRHVYLSEHNGTAPSVSLHSQQHRFEDAADYAWEPQTPTLPVLQDSISMLSVSDVFDTGSNDGQRYAAEAQYANLEGTQRAIGSNGPSEAAGHAAQAHSGRLYRTANVEHDPIFLRTTTATQHNAVHHTMDSTSPVGPQASIDSAGLVWHHKRAIARPKTAPKSTNAGGAVPVLDLAHLKTQQSHDWTSAQGITDALPKHDNTTAAAPQAQRPITAPHSKRRPTFRESTHAPLHASLTTRTAPIVRAEGVAKTAVPPPLEAVQRAFDTARDAAIAQLVEWTRVQQAQEIHRQQNLAHYTGTEDWESLQYGPQTRNITSRGTPRIPDSRPMSGVQPQRTPRERPEKPAFGMHGELWPEQLRLYEPASGATPPRSRSPQRPASTSIKGSGTRGKAGKTQPTRKSRFDRLIGKLARQYAIDPTVPETAQALFPTQNGRVDLEDGSYRYTPPEPLSPHSARRGGTLCLLEGGSGTVRDGPTYAAPLKRSDEAPLYPHYSPRRPVSGRPGSRSASRGSAGGV